MRAAFIAVGIYAIAAIFGSASFAQTVQRSVTNIALRSGETQEVADLWYVARDCRSLLAGKPEVEIMDGPPGVAVTVKEALVVPRSNGCAKAIPGGKLMISANDIEDYSDSRLVIRLTYKTKNGPRLRSEHMNVTLFPN